MIQPIVTQAIVLSRVNYAEADRIIGFLTADHGKISVIAKGVRKQKSKLAGGIELFSISDISYITGRRDIGTLISSRLKSHFGNIVKTVDSTALAYEIIGLVNKATEEGADSEYFTLAKDSLSALDQPTLSTDIVACWFYAHLLKLSGHQPNLKTDITGNALAESQKYDFDLSEMKFERSQNGLYSAKQIKFLRLCFAAVSPAVIAKIENGDDYAKQAKQLLLSMLRPYVRI